MYTPVEIQLRSGCFRLLFVQENDSTCTKP